jgi:hypothetical protein
VLGCPLFDLLSANRVDDFFGRVVRFEDFLKRMDVSLVSHLIEVANLRPLEMSRSDNGANAMRGLTASHILTDSEPRLPAIFELSVYKLSS